LTTRYSCLKVPPEWRAWTPPTDERQVCINSGMLPKYFFAVPELRFPCRRSNDVAFSLLSHGVDRCGEGRRALNCDYASYARCRLGTSDTCLRRYGICAVNFCAASGYRHRK